MIKINFCVVALNGLSKVFDCLKYVLVISKLNASSNINEVIRTVLNFLSFL